MTCKENNAIAEVNLATASVEEIYPLGTKSWRNLEIDTSDKDTGKNLIIPKMNLWYMISSFLK